MICRSCGAGIPEASRYCNFCGADQSPQQTRSPKKRGNGQGTVYRRNGKWVAEVTLGYAITEDGKIKRKSRRKCGFERKKDAIAYLEQLRTAKPSVAETFSDLYAEFESRGLQKLSKTKAQAYQIAWRKIQTSIARIKITEATVPQLQQITDECGNSYYTKRDIKNLLSHLYKLAVRDEKASSNKAQYIDLPPLVAAERTTFTEPEIQALWADADQYVVQHILVMIYTGMRPAELLSVQLQNIHLDEHYMTGGVKTRKSKARKIIIPRKLSEIIRRLAEAAEGDSLSNYRKHAFYDAWNSYRAAAGLRPELTPYCCRHTYITRLTALKVSPAMLQELAGHEDYETTLTYTHLSIEDRLAEVDRLL